MSHFFLIRNTHIKEFTKWTFYLYTFSLVFLSGMSIGNVISKAIGYALVLLFLVINVFIYGNKIIFFKELKFIGAWLIFCLISGFFAKDSLFFLDRIITVIQLIVLYFIGYSIIRIYDINIKMLFYIIIISAILIFIQGMLIQSSVSPLESDPRLYSAQGNPNTIANFGIYAFLLSIYLIITEDKIWKRILNIIFAVFFVFGVLETESRKGVIVLPVIIILMVILNGYHKFKTGKNRLNLTLKYCIVGILMVVMVVMIVQYFKTTEYFDRFQRLNLFLQAQGGSSESVFRKIWDYSTYERRQFIKYGMSMWLDNFWFGKGLDNFRTSINEYWTSARHLYAHNNYVELLSTTGIIGFMMYYLFYITLFSKMIKLLRINNLKREQRFLIHVFITGMLSLMIIEMVIVSYYLKFIWLMLLIFTVYTDKLQEAVGNKIIV